MKPNIIFFKTAIIKEIPQEGKTAVPGVEYCAGAEDFDGMGLAALCVYDFANELPIVYGLDNLALCHRLFDRADYLIGGYFDNKVLAANNLQVAQIKSVDLLLEIYNAATETAAGATDLALQIEANPEQAFAAICAANLDTSGAVGTSAEWPRWWQQGQHAKVISACLQDVMLSFRLWRKIINTGAIVDPTNTKRNIKIILSRFNGFCEAA